MRWYDEGMALFLRQDDQRSELQKRIGAELQEKLKHDKPLEYEKPESNLETQTHETRHLGVWITLTLLMVGVLIGVIISLN